MEFYDVSVIVTTRAEERHIANCLESLRDQAYPAGKIEIIVVDNNSRDQTKTIALRYTDKVYNLGPERSAQRNYGGKRSSGKYLLFLDADMSLSRNVVRECVEKCEQGGNIALYIPEKVLGSGFWIRVRDFERSFYSATCIDCVRFVRRDKFLEVDGFDQRLTGPEDWDFDRRMRASGKVGIIDAPLYHNEVTMDLKDYLRGKGYYYGSLTAYRRKWGVNDKLVKRQLGIGYRYFGVFLENGKWIRFIAHPLLALGVYFLRILVGAGYLKTMIVGKNNGRLRGE
jgi:glycosyltransferase involved in cell wall biosynthesis